MKLGDNFSETHFIKDIFCSGLNLYTHKKIIDDEEKQKEEEFIYFETRGTYNK